MSLIQSAKKNQYFRSLPCKAVCIAISVMLISACSPLGMGSTTKRSAKLSTGIQKAYRVDPYTAQRVSPMIVQSADKHQVDPLLIAAMIHQESSYRSNATSPAGAVGLTQIIPRYWQQTCPGNLYEENINVNCGTYILARYNHTAGSWKKALAYYNVGPTGYETNRKMRKQGKRYAKQVKQHKQTLKSSL